MPESSRVQKCLSSVNVMPDAADKGSSFCGVLQALEALYPFVKSCQRPSSSSSHCLLLVIFGEKLCCSTSLDRSESDRMMVTVKLGEMRRVTLIYMTRIFL